VKRRQLTSPQKIAYWLKWTPAAIVGLLLAVLVILVSPIRRYRFYVLPVDEIGPLIQYPHIYTWTQTQLPASRNRDVFVYRPDTFVANSLLLSKWCSLLTVTKSRTIWVILSIFTRLNLKRHLVRNGIDHPSAIARYPARASRYLVPLTESERAAATKNLSEVGLVPQEPFVCLIVRDGSYKATFRREPLIHDVKEAYRNQRIGDFEQCADVATEFDVKLVRMGVRVEQRFPGNYESVIDYAASGRRDEVTDLFLLSNCSLCVSTSVGSDSVCGIAGIPRLMMNIVPYHVTANAYAWDTILPVRFRLRKTHVELSLQETLQYRSVKNFRGSEELEVDGLEIIRATPSEIADAMRDALRRLNQVENLTSRDADLQTRYWNLIEKNFDLSELDDCPRPVVAPSYLKLHADWLDV